MSENIDEQMLIAGFNGDDVISFRGRRYTDRFSQFSRAFINKYHKSISSMDFRSVFSDRWTVNQQNDDNTWFKEGEPCEVLKVGDSKWQKGRIRFRFVAEFIPDEEPTSLNTLDTLRDQISTNGMVEDSNWPPETIN